MECLRSFTIGINQNNTFATSGTNVKSWGTLGNYHWVVRENVGTSIFDIQGFKTIRIFGIEMVGNVQTDLSASDGGIVLDYSFIVNITGVAPQASGVVRVSPNFWNLTPTSSNFQLNKYSNKVIFADPFEACTALTFSGFEAQGQNGETLNSVQLDIDLQFIFYYKYDGE
jgi:hypothetical protein